MRHDEQLKDQIDLKKYYQSLYQEANKESDRLKSENAKLSAELKKQNKELSSRIKRSEEDHLERVQDLESSLRICRGDVRKALHGQVVDISSDGYYNDILLSIISAAGPSHDGGAYDIIEQVKTLRKFYDENKPEVG